MFPPAPGLFSTMTCWRVHDHRFRVLELLQQLSDIRLVGALAVVVVVGIGIAEAELGKHCPDDAFLVINAHLAILLDGDDPAPVDIVVPKRRRAILVMADLLPASLGGRRGQHGGGGEHQREGGNEFQGRSKAVHHKLPWNGTARSHDALR